MTILDKNKTEMNKLDKNRTKMTKYQTDTEQKETYQTKRNGRIKQIHLARRKHKCRHKNKALNKTHYTSAAQVKLFIIIMIS